MTYLTSPALLTLPNVPQEPPSCSGSKLLHVAQGPKRSSAQWRHTGYLGSMCIATTWRWGKYLNLAFQYMSLLRFQRSMLMEFWQSENSVLNWDTLLFLSLILRHDGVENNKNFYYQSPTISLNTWIHMAMIYRGPADGEGILIYHDGVEMRSPKHRHSVWHR